MSDELAFGHDPKKVADWIVTTCLAYGSTVYTAYKVAGAFVEGLGWEPPSRWPKAKPDGRRTRTDGETP